MADAIWNNNYLLSNLDAQKLYAQSPLTTGVSGSSAYIGIEPSATVDFTLLWSGSAVNGTSATLSEPWYNFNFIMAEANTNDGPPNKVNIFGGTYEVPTGGNFNIGGITLAGPYLKCYSLRLNGMTASLTSCKETALTTTAAGYDITGSLRAVWGINHK